MISPDIFRMYDIRGIYNKDLTEETSELIGKAAGTYYKRNGIDKVVVGRDNRMHGPQLQEAFIRGLTSTGCAVTDVGVVITPMIYFSWHRLDARAAVQVTASHNPPEYNGFKMTLNKQGMVGEQYQQVYEIAKNGNFEQGEGGVEGYNLWPHYKKAILDSISVVRPLKVVIDTGNGTCSLYAPELFREMGLEVVELFTESDGNFPNHPPYPQKTEYYGELIERINKEKADFGLAFDGDGDRVGVYDEEGKFIQNDVLAILFARDILKNNPGATIVMNTSTSMAVLEDMENHGGKPILWKTGYPFIVAKMKEESAVFGGEISGHFFFADRYYGYDDAFYAAARFVEIADKLDKPASALLEDFPEYRSSPEFRIELPAGKDKFEITDKIGRELKEEFSEAEIIDFDGVRFTFPDRSWGLIRPSNTESVIAGRVEAKTKERLEELKALVKDKLANYEVELDWSNIF